MVVEGVSIAMWSGPRNISTAMMYSFDNRGDCFASDEPLYAHYLSQTGIKHPDADAVMTHHETDADVVTDYLTGTIPGGANVWYQKHMCHHILPDMGTGWLTSLENCFLIRDPREVLLSLSRITDEVSLWATGLPQQARLLEQVAEESGEVPPILDARDILEDPRGMLELLCERVGIRFNEKMLSWRPGPRECDGVWAEHWYDSVWSSTGFSPYRARTGDLTPGHEEILSQALPIYEDMHSRRMSL